MSSPNPQASPTAPDPESRKRDASQMADSPEEPEWAPVDVEFDFSAKKKPRSWDRILTVGGVDFHVIKAHLAMHSGFFHGMFFPPHQGSGYKETNQEKVSLSGCDAGTFQYILELIGGGNRLSDSNVQEVLRVSKMWLFGSVVEKCEQFLKEKSEYDLADKLDLARMFDLEDLKTYLISSNNPAPLPTPALCSVLASGPFPPLPHPAQAPGYYYFPPHNGPGHMPSDHPNFHARPQVAPIAPNAPAADIPRHLGGADDRDVEEVRREQEVIFESVQARRGAPGEAPGRAPSPEIVQLE